MDRAIAPCDLANLDRRELFRVALDISPDLVYVLDISARFIEVNNTICDVLGYTREELLAKYVFHINVGSKPAFVRRRLAHLVEVQPETRMRRAVMRRKDGTMFPVEVHRRAVTFGNTTLIVAVARDITANVAIEKEVRHGRAKLHHLLSATPAVIYSCGAPSPVYPRTFMSANVKAQLGYDARDFTRAPTFWVDHIHPDDRERVLTDLDQLTQTDFHVHEYRFRHRNGAYRWMHDQLRLVRNAKGAAVEIIGSWIDITERKRTEDALRSSEERLVLSEIRLRRALRDRERLGQDLHDNIVQAMYAIGMQLESAQVRKKPAEMAAALEEAIEGLNGVIREVRQYISGSGPQLLSGAQLRAELANLVKVIGLNGTPRFRVNVDGAAVARLTPGDAEHVLQIAREALSNALRHAKARTGELSLRAVDGGVRLEVRDDGTGFDPLKRRRGGRGLQNMRARTHEMGAQLELQSAPGKGTHIVLQIPNRL